MSDKRNPASSDAVLVREESTGKTFVVQGILETPPWWVIIVLIAASQFHTINRALSHVHVCQFHGLTFSEMCTANIAIFSQFLVFYCPSWRYLFHCFGSTQFKIIVVVILVTILSITIIFKNLLWIRIIVLIPFYINKDI